MVDKTGLTRQDFGQTHSRLAQRERGKLTHRIADLEAKIKRLEGELTAAEEIRGTVFNLSQQDLSSPKWIDPSPKPKGKKTALPHLLISDEQVGEHIVGKEIEGINSYDHNEYVKRHTRCAQKLVEISEQHMGGQAFPTAIIGFLGDAINGEIHADIAETNTLRSIPAARLVVETRRDAIDFWLKHFENLFIIIIPGNHGRTTPKPRFKKYAALNYETFIGWWLQSIYAKEPRVRIVVPESGDYFTTLWGKGLFWTHGDRMGRMSGQSSGQGFAGRALPIVRGSKNIREQQASIGRRVDYIHIGHWHERMEVGGTFANGAMAGYNEFAYGQRYIATPAEQWLYYLNADYGATARWPIFLSPQPKTHPHDSDVII